MFNSRLWPESGSDGAASSDAAAVAAIRDAACIELIKMLQVDDAEGSVTRERLAKVLRG